MSHFIETQSRRLAEEVDKYAQKLGFIECAKKPQKGDGETVPGESVPFEAFQDSKGQWITFSNGGRYVTVAIAEREDIELLDAEHAIFPCGVHLDGPPSPWFTPCLSRPNRDGTHRHRVRM